MFRKTAIILLVLLASILTSNYSLAVDYMSDAKQYIEKGEYKAAIIQLKNHLKTEPMDAQARYLLGTTYFKIGEFAGAEKELKSAYKLNPDSVSLSLAYAELLLLKKEYQQVNKILNTQFSDKKSEQRRRITRAYAYIGLGQLADAKEILNSIPEENKNSQIYNGLAQLALMENERVIAAQWVQKSLQIEKDNKKALQILAKIANYNNKYSEALSIYNSLILSNPDDLTLYNERAATHVALKQLQEAEKDVSKVLEKLKNQPRANYLLAQIKLKKQDYKAAENAARNVLNFVPQHYPSMLILGVANLAQGNFNQAEKYFIQYLSSNPDNLYVQYLLANLYLGKGEAEQALLIIEGIGEDKIAQNSQLLSVMGSAYMLQGDHEKGIEALNKARTLAPDNKTLQEKLAIGQYKAGDIDNAISDLEEMVNSGKASNKIKYLLIVSYIQKNQLKKAEVQIKELLKETPDVPAPYNLMAVVEKLNGNTDKAEAAYKKSLQLDENNVNANQGLARIAIEKNDLNQAKDYLNKVVQINDKHIKSFITLAAIAEKENSPQDMEKYLLTGFENVSGNKKAQRLMAYALGKFYVKQNHPQKLLSLAQQLNKTYPDDLGVLYFLAAAEITNNEASAEQTLFKIINKNKKDTKYRLMLANLLAKQSGRENDVIQLLDEVIEILPDNSDPVARKAAYLIETQQYQQAMDVADYLHSHFPDLALGKQLKGGIYLKQKDYDLALENYQQAYKIQANNKVLIIIAELLAIQGKEADAIKLLADELKKDEQNMAAHFKLAMLYQKNNQVDEAIKHYQIVIDNNNENVLALNNLAWLYAQQNNPQALDFAKKAYEKEPKSAPIADTYAYILVRRGRIAEGIAILEKAVKLAPQIKEVQLHLAEAYYLNGDNHKAKVILQPILTSEQNSSEAEKAKKLLEKINM